MENKTDEENLEKLFCPPETKTTGVWDLHIRD